MTTTQMTQTTFGADMPDYISIYDKPKRPKGRPISKLTEEEKAQRYRDSSKKYYDKNKEQILIHKKKLMTLNV
mgnify:CR=1 FL=1